VTRALGRDFCDVGKDGKEDVKLLERVFFSYFAKKIRIGKPDDKPLEMLS
jgi:hypothetical protein